MLTLGGLTHYRLALRLGLSYVDGLNGNAVDMDWFVDMVRWVAGHDDVRVNITLDLSWSPRWLMRWFVSRL